MIANIRDINENRDAAKSAIVIMTTPDQKGLCDQEFTVFSDNSTGILERLFIILNGPLNNEVLFNAYNIDMAGVDKTRWYQLLLWQRWEHWQGLEVQRSLRVMRACLQTAYPQDFT